MCAPIALTGLQLAGSLAGAAASAREMKREATEAERAARADAATLTARAANARAEALDRTAAQRVRAFTSGVDPQSNSVVESLAAAHARNLDGVGTLGQSAAQVLYEGQMRARALRAGRHAALARSLLGLATTLAERGNGGNRLRI